MSLRLNLLLWKSGPFRNEALTQLKSEAKTIYQSLMRKYQNDLPLFKALAKGERVLMAVDRVKN